MKLSESFTYDECSTVAFALHNQWRSLKLNWASYMKTMPAERHATLIEQRLATKRLALRFKKLARKAASLELRSAR